MANLSGLSDARVVLLATHLCANGNLTGLQRLCAQFHSLLGVDLVLRIILTFLPESTEPALYTPLLQHLRAGSVPQIEGEDPDTSSVTDIPEPTARKQVRTLHLFPLSYDETVAEDTSGDSLTQFLIHRAYRIDTETGLQPLIIQLLEPFVQHSDFLRTWLISTLLPLLRFNYEYNPENGEALSLEILDSLDSGTAINTLLSKTEKHNEGGDVGRDLRGLVGPWMYGNGRSKRRKLDREARKNSISLPSGDIASTGKDNLGWQDVNEWLLSTSLKDFPLVVEAIDQWGGPQDVDYGGYGDLNETTTTNEQRELEEQYGQAGLSAIYATPEASVDVLNGSCRMLSKIATLIVSDGDINLGVDDNRLPNLDIDIQHISNTSKASILQNTLMTPSNPLTYPNKSSIAFLDALLVSIRTLYELGHLLSCRAAAEKCLFSSDEAQLFQFRDVVGTLAAEPRHGRDWRKCRTQLLWLRTWRDGSEFDQLDKRQREGHGLFWRVPRTVLEMEILKAMLTARQLDLAVEIYTDWANSRLSTDEVETAVKEVIFSFYDNASNGNKTRGGIKRALDILNAFKPHFPESKSFKEIDALISATHALSFYSLTLQHGVPFQPVSIRVHHDPLSLLGKVLDQNPNAYTKLDDLISIGHNLVVANLPAHSNPDEPHSPVQPATPGGDPSRNAERRIIYLAISSALSSNDFGTAYSYILTRLTPPSMTSNSSTSTNPTDHDDISWRAAYNAGRHRSTVPETGNAASLQNQISHLSQRMELLSLALVLAPSPDPLPEILGVWRRCDEEMTVLRDREIEEAESWDTRGDMESTSTVPGGFMPSDNELDAMETERERAKRSRLRHAGRSGAASGGYEEAPMGLFDVARGAAQAISKNAFPLHGASVAAGGKPAITRGNSHNTTRENEHISGGEEGSEFGYDDTEAGRTRKRDVVSSMVTGGLASGIGWVLGAQPVNRES
ncbi:hypothetical protein FQN54_003680 [Arachnomyces sp. PD_36]|nr:hypothetical protein FQN54_003680 [Arachnomyces sp. PD_36]